MSWEIEDRWFCSFSDPYGLTRLVQVLLPEMLTAKHGRIAGGKTFPS